MFVLSLKRKKSLTYCLQLLHVVIAITKQVEKTKKNVINTI